MYDAGVTAHYVAAEITRTANASDEADRFYGVYHTIEEVRQFVAHANALVDQETGELRRKLTSVERQWIRNERTLCMLDFTYWATRYAKIVDYRNQLVTFAPNIAQNIVISVWAEMERKQWAIMMLQLKARQMGVSTLTELAVQHRIQFYPDVNAVVASVEEDKSAKMFRMVEVSLSHQPWFLMPRNKKWKIGKLVEFSNNSAVSVESGNQLSGIAMGTTPQVAHMSEVAKIRNAETLIDQSLLHAVHEDTFTLVVLESTAEGFDNWFYRTWKDAMQYWSEGKATLCPLFLPWFVATDIYPTAAWIRKHPVPVDWVPSEMTDKHAIRAALSVKTNARLQSLFPDGWTMPREQQWYYEVKREEAVRKKQLNTFLSEMPADPDEAFQSSQISAVDPVLVNAYRERALGCEPLAVFAIIASEDELHSRFTLSKRLWDRTKKPIVIETYTGRVVSKYTLQPLIFDGYDGDPKGKLYVWEWPEDGQEYGLGCDTGDGVDQDSSVVEVMKKSTVWKPWSQICEFASPYMNAMDLWPIVQAIATFYSVKRQGELKQPKLVIECRGTGDLLQNELRKRGWSNFHIPVRVDKRRLDVGKSHYMGIMTAPWVRRAMVDKFLSMFNNEEIELASPWLIEEVRRLERDEAKQQFRAAGGAHDDRVMGCSFVLLSLDVLGLNPKSHRRTEATDDDPSYQDAHAYVDPDLKSLNVAVRPSPMSRMRF